MDTYRKNTMGKRIRRVFGVLLVVVGLSTTWAWGQVARLAEPAAETVEAPPVALYAAWQPEGAEQANLFRSTDEGATWLPVSLPAAANPVAWADNGRSNVAVALADGSLLLSEDQGESWLIVEIGLDVSSLVWGDDASLYLGTDGAGVYELATDDVLLASSLMQGELASARIVGLSLSGDRLFAAMPNTILYTDDAGRPADQVTWTQSAPLAEAITTLVATDKQTVYAGTATTGVYKSSDAGQTWQPAWDGLGLAAGQMVHTTALAFDSQEPGLLYVAVDYLIGSTQVHASAGGTFVTLGSGASWQPLAGPVFPTAQRASSLILVPGKPLHVQAVTAGGLQAYAPDVMRILAGLESEDATTRASAARQLGLARPQGVWSELLAVLDDPDPAVSWAASDALGRIGDLAAVPGLVVAMDYPNQQVRIGAARALGMLQTEAAVEPLRAMFLQGNGSEVSVAGEALGRIGDQAAIDALLNALADPEPSARWHVAMAALEGIGEPAVDPLLAMLDSEDAYARRNAAQALGWVGSPAATGALVRSLEKDGDAAVRAQAAWALGEIQSPAVRRALERAQRSDEAARVQAEATRALALLPESAPAAVSGLARWVPVLDRLQPVRWLVLALSVAGAAWLMMGNTRWVPAILRLGSRHS
ncbi:MAG: HEAT repeat domain-containing protein [Anaerolineae bacterium]